MNLKERALIGQSFELITSSINPSFVSSQFPKDFLLYHNFLSMSLLSVRHSWVCQTSFQQWISCDWMSFVDWKNDSSEWMETKEWRWTQNEHLSFLVIQFTFNIMYRIHGVTSNANQNAKEKYLDCENFSSCASASNIEHFKFPNDLQSMLKLNLNKCIVSKPVLVTWALRVYGIHCIETLGFRISVIVLAIPSIWCVQK